MESSPHPLVAALRHSHDRLRAAVEPLGDDALNAPSYASEWSVAQVLSHLGSGAEIFGMFVQAGLAGEQVPGQEAFGPIWQAWNERAPRQQADDALAADDKLISRFESLDPEQLAGVRLNLFGMDTDLAGVARMRLNEHAVHTWDIEVSLDPGATLLPEAVGLMIDSVGQIARWAGQAEGKQFAVTVETTGPERSLELRADGGVTLEPAAGAAGKQGAEAGARLRIPAEALLRLVYGRLDPAHAPRVEAAGIELNEIRQIFPGI